MLLRCHSLFLYPILIRYSYSWSGTFSIHISALPFTYQFALPFCHYHTHTHTHTSVPIFSDLPAGSFLHVQHADHQFCLLGILPHFICVYCVFCCNHCHHQFCVLLSNSYVLMWNSQPIPVPNMEIKSYLHQLSLIPSTESDPCLYTVSTTCLCGLHLPSPCAQMTSSPFTNYVHLLHPL